MDIPSPLFDILMVTVETFTGLYPTFIKMIEDSIETKIFIRIIVFLGIALITAEKKDILSVCEISFTNFLRYAFLGLISFGTMYYSQKGLKELPVETNLTIHRSFPIITTIIAYSLLGNHQPIEYIPLFLFAYMLMLFILRPKSDHIKKFKKLSPEKKQKKWEAFNGIFFAFILSCISFIIYSLKIESFETGIIRTNVGALFVLIFYLINSQIIPIFSFGNTIKMIILNLCMGYSLNRIRSTMRDSIPEVYSAIFVFLGTSMAFILSEIFIFLKRKPPPDFDKTAT